MPRLLSRSGSAGVPQSHAPQAPPRAPCLAEWFGALPCPEWIDRLAPNKIGVPRRPLSRPPRIPASLPVCRQASTDVRLDAQLAPPAPRRASPDAGNLKRPMPDPPPAYASSPLTLDQTCSPTRSLEPQSSIEPFRWSRHAQKCLNKGSPTAVKRCRDDSIPRAPPPTCVPEQPYSKRSV